MPRPGTAVIPHGWAAHHRDAIAGTMTATCDLRHPGGTGKTFDPNTGSSSTTAATPYVTGARCRVQAITEPGATTLDAAQLVTTVAYLVTIAFDDAGAADAKVDDLITITAADDNATPGLVGRTLTVKSRVRGSLAWELDLTCVDDLG